MKKNVIITRSKEENIILAQKITALCFNPISSSMISHEIITCDFTRFKPYTHLIITSKFAAQIVSEHYPYNIDAYVVGDESAKIVSRNKMVHVKKIYDNLSSLQEAVRNNESTRFLYLSGNHISDEIPFTDRYIIYNTEYAKSLSPDALEIIHQNRADFVMLYSKNSAQNFIDLIKSHIHLQNLQNSVVIAMSSEVGDVLKPYVKDVLYPKRPNADEMLKLLRGASSR